MPPTSDRREAIFNQTLAAEQVADKYLTDANPAALEIFRLSRLWLSDVRTFWLASEVDPRNEGVWLTQAEQHLGRAIGEFERLRKLVDGYGGPTKVALIGG